MPLYVYQCPQCFSEKEMLKKITDENPEICDKCACQMEKSVTAPSGFVLKGDGWYKSGSH